MPPCNDFDSKYSIVCGSDSFAHKNELILPRLTFDSIQLNITCGKNANGNLNTLNNAIVVNAFEAVKSFPAAVYVKNAVNEINCGANANIKLIPILHPTYLPNIFNSFCRILSIFSPIDNSHAYILTIFILENNSFVIFTRSSRIPITLFCNFRP